MEDLVERLKTGTYYVTIGTYADIGLEAVVREDVLYFSHNLGATNVPTKRRAAEMVRTISEHFDELCESSVAFREFAETKTFVASLIVFSGQMDFTVCEMIGGQIKWHTDLDDTD